MYKDTPKIWTVKEIQGNYLVLNSEVDPNLTNWIRIFRWWVQLPWSGWVNIDSGCRYRGGLFHWDNDD